MQRHQRSNQGVPLRCFETPCKYTTCSIGRQTRSSFKWFIHPVGDNWSLSKLPAQLLFGRQSANYERASSLNTVLDIDVVRLYSIVRRASRRRKNLYKCVPRTIRRLKPITKKFELSRTQAKAIRVRNLCDAFFRELLTKRFLKSSMFVYEL